MNFSLEKVGNVQAVITVKLGTADYEANVKKCTASKVRYIHVTQNVKINFIRSRNFNIFYIFGFDFFRKGRSVHQLSQEKFRSPREKIYSPR